MSKPHFPRGAILFCTLALAASLLGARAVSDAPTEMGLQFNDFIYYDAAPAGLFNEDGLRLVGVS